MLKSCLRGEVRIEIDMLRHLEEDGAAIWGAEREYVPFGATAQKVSLELDEEGTEEV